MVVIVDTCSLSRLVQYYLPFDKGNQLIPLISTLIKNVKNGEMIVTEAVFEECKYLKKGIILEKLSFLKEKDFKDRQIKTDQLIPDKTFMNYVNHNFVNRTIFNKLDAPKQKAQKEAYIKSGDYSLLLCAYESVKDLKDSIFNDEAYILTEESATENDNKFFYKIPNATENDNKFFYKIPNCCRVFGAKYIDLANYLEIVTEGKLELILKNS